ncbi:MAG TPA: tRNA (adenosine(37)-N6)-threonylcarbamoyltransferase complex transferase subunit TsaD [Tepidisphaeraceae bacterium]|nr:tRNA (adenosine(37)-N6)-threonylcarbamoyltransferase complex transferase subunit TsaD [Tepidisphaeraceae bacterium]
MALILGIESTCDETAAAVVRDGTHVLSNVIATQFPLHEKFRGVVPEIASRAHIENLLPVLKESLSQAGCTFADVDAISITHRPGLIGSLLIGLTAAKTLAWTLNKPLIAVDHVHAHLYSVMLDSTSKPPQFPAVGLVISGGHTSLYSLQSFSNIILIGSTIDDAIGEAYDKVAAILNLPYPGGPPIDSRAAKGSPTVQLPRTLLEKNSLDFSFSGLKTAVLYHVKGTPQRIRHDLPPLPKPPPPELTPQHLADICASFQNTCIEIVLEKLRRAVRHTSAQSILIGGGVSANRGLRAALKQLHLPVLFPPLPYCTDNAAMSAGLAHLFYERQQFSPLSLDALTHSQFRDPA